MTSISCAQKASDGGYIFAGFTKSYGAGGKDVLVVKMDATGNHKWNKTFGGAKSDEAYSVEQTLDGLYPRWPIKLARV